LIRNFSKENSYEYIKQSLVILLILLALSIFLSPFVNGVTHFALGIIWLAIATKTFPAFFKEKRNWWLISLYLVHLLGLIYTNNYLFAFNDLRIKFSWLLLPVILFSVGGLSRKQWMILLWLVTAALLVSFLFSYSVYLKNPAIDRRQISVFISHIRLSLILVSFVFFHLIELFESKPLSIKLIHALGVVFILYYLFFLSSLTGIMVFVGVLPVFLYKKLKKSTLGVLLISIFILIPVVYILKIAHDFYPSDTFKQVCINNSLNGNENSFLRLKMVENGEFVGVGLNESELEEEWNEKFEKKYPFAYKKWFNVQLARYLASKHLNRNEQGLSKLRSQDLKNLQKGYANVIQAEKSVLYNRIYQIIWQIYHYKNGANPSGHTLTQRLEYWKTAWHIFKSNLIIGVGTGDLPQAFEEQYRKDNTRLIPKKQLRTHNQIFSFYLAFGILGGTVCILALVLPFYLTKKKSIHLVVFFMIMLLSLLNEDTFETQAGSSFFALFYSIFLYSDGLEEDKFIKF